MKFAVPLLFACALSSADPAFDVASITPSATARAGGEGSGRERATVTPNSVTLSNAGLNFAIQFAYNVKAFQVSGPEWIASLRYDITGKAAHALSREELRAMMRTLLADRFKLVAHRENKVQPVFELLAGKNPKLQPTQATQDSPTRVVDGAFVFQHVTMPDLAEHLAELAGVNRPVVDRSGLTGTFDLTLPGAARRTLEDPASIFASVEDAGLSLRAAKAPIEMLIVDSASRPTRN
jgi:uncharacterized protein (TIGR03435 family)